MIKKVTIVNIRQDSLQRGTIGYKDYEESYASVTAIEAWRLLMALTVKMNSEFRFFDLKTAYLYSDIKETALMALPPGFKRVYGEENVFRSKKGVYGFSQSGRNWYIKLKNTLIEVGFKPLISENCIFILSHKHILVAIVIYVDDFTLIYNNKEAYHEILLRLKKKFEIEETTNSGKFLNITIKTFESCLGMSQAESILRNC